MALREVVDLSGDGGVAKRVLREGSGASPPTGAFVDLHAVIMLPGGTRVASTRGEEPLHFCLGLASAQMIPAWELAVPTMCPGEIALITSNADHAFGGRGLGEHVGPGQPVVFELELLSWKTNDVHGGTAAGISRRWIDKLVELQDEGLSVPTATANEMLHDMVAEENRDATAAAAAEEACAKEMRTLRKRSESARRSSGLLPEAELEVVGGGLVGEPIVQALHAKEEGHASFYRWVEGRSDVEVYVDLGVDLTLRDVDVTLSRTSISASVGDVALEGKLAGRIDVEASSWGLVTEDGCEHQSLYILLVKEHPTAERWHGLFASSPSEDEDILGLQEDDIDIHYKL